MKQSRLASLTETTLSTGAGFGLAVALQATVLPAFGVDIAIHQNLAFAGVMTLASIARQYGMRRLFEALHLRTPLSPAMTAIIAERTRQSEIEGYTIEHDDEHLPGTLICAASAYLQSATFWLRAANRARTAPQNIIPPDIAPPDTWPFGREYWKPESARRDPVKAGALILAELDSIARRRTGSQWTRGELKQFRTAPQPPIVLNNRKK